jgi:chitodextrinase
VTPAAATVQHIGVPAYFNPNGSPGSGYWTQIDQAGPAVGLAIANPDNGPGTAFDQGYANAVQAAASAGAHVIGYVDTGYFGTTGRTTRGGLTTTAAWTTQVQGDVDNWYSWYGSYGLSGIFFDDGLNDCGTNNAHVSLYQAVNTYTKQHHPGATTVDNPGTAADQCYASAADVLVMFEGTYASYTSWTAPAWELASSTPNQFWHLVYNTPTRANMDNAVSLSKQRNAGYLYVTPDDLPNPWDTLPTGTYWSDEIAQTGGSGGGGGDTTAPSAPGTPHATSVTATSVTLSWGASTDNVGVTAYDVYAAGSVVASVGGGTTSATVSNLSPNTAYTFTVKARDAAGNVSAASAPVTVTTAAGGGGGTCTPVAGSGNITNYSACMTATTETFTATFNVAVSLHHVYINSDNNQSTGFFLPSPSTRQLGADYMIENAILYRSLSHGWSWTPVTGSGLTMTQNGNVFTWTVPRSSLSGAAATQQAEFNGNTFYTAPVTFS